MAPEDEPDHNVGECECEVEAVAGAQWRGFCPGGGPYGSRLGLCTKNHPCSVLNNYASFKDFPSAVLTLYKMSTGNFIDYTLNGLAPKYISDLIQIYTPARALRSEGQLQLVRNDSRASTHGWPHRQYVSVSRARLWCVIASHESGLTRKRTFTTT
ncbi:hypothetical protein WMY93_018437 [Mugilogobius chulae]|uniref:Uncharacterized protein n=1 Tax=Mugilogobius chulae TaxID=88201 RepID=A0AAW0NK05_9GOBI